MLFVASLPTVEDHSVKNAGLTVSMVLLGLENRLVNQNHYPVHLYVCLPFRSSQPMWFRFRAHLKMDCTNPYLDRITILHYDPTASRLTKNPLNVSSQTEC